ATFGVTVNGATQLVLAGTLGADGDSATTATVAPTSVPTSTTIAFHAHDHAGNTCADPEPYDVVYDGCDLAVTSPLGPVPSDADGDPANGTQVDVSLAIDPACAGQTLVSSCGLDNPSTTVAADGSAQLRVNWCGADPCEHTAGCTFTVTNASGVSTSAGAE